MSHNNNNNTKALIPKVGVGYWNQFIGLKRRSHGFFFSFHYDFLSSEFVNLDSSYHFTLRFSSSKSSLIFNALFLSLSSFNFLSSLWVHQYYDFAHVQTSYTILFYITSILVITKPYIISSLRYPSRYAYLSIKTFASPPLPSFY